MNLLLQVTQMHFTHVHTHAHTPHPRHWGQGRDLPMANACTVSAQHTPHSPSHLRRPTPPGSAPPCWVRLLSRLLGSPSAPRLPAEGGPCPSLCPSLSYFKSHHRLFFFYPQLSWSFLRLNNFCNFSVSLNNIHGGLSLLCFAHVFISLATQLRDRTPRSILPHHPRR